MDWDFAQGELGAKTCTSGDGFSSGAPKVECCLHLLSERLSAYETMTWGEILRDNRTGSHFIPLDELGNHALRGKFESLVIHDGIGDPLSLRLGATDRLWGIVLNDGTFEAICYDPYHKGYPVEKKHT